MLVFDSTQFDTIPNMRKFVSDASDLQVSPDVTPGEKLHMTKEDPEYALYIRQEDNKLYGFVLSRTHRGESGCVSHWVYAAQDLTTGQDLHQRADGHMPGWTVLIFND